MASRFFGGASSESSSSEDESEDEIVEEQVAAPPPSAKASAFMKGGDDSDSDGDKKRVVRSHRDKRWDQMQEAVASMKNHIKINDWIAVTEDYDKLNKLLQKAKPIVEREGTPTFYFLALAHLEEANARALEDKDAKKKMSPSNAKALNSLKQKLRKVIAQHKAQIDAAKASGGGGGGGASEEEEEEESESESESEDEAPAGKSMSLQKPAPAAGGKAAAFMKDAPAPAAKAKKGGKAAKAEAKPAKAAAPPKPQGPKPIKDYNEADIDKRLDQILQQRGRKATDRKETISVLSQLADVTKRPSKLVELLGHVIAFQFDLHMSMLAAMPTPVWKAIFDVFRRILQTLVDNPDLKIEVLEGSTVVDTTQMTTAEAGDDDDEFIDSGVTQMTSNVLSYLERLDDEFYKSLQLQDPHQPAYVARLKDEVPLVNLMQDTLAYYDSKQDRSAENLADSARVSQRIVEHIYYREQALFDTAAENASKRKALLLDERDALRKAAAEAEAVAAEEEARLAEEAAAEKAAKEAAKVEASDDDDDEEGEEDEAPEPVVTENRKAADAAAAAAAAADREYDAFSVPRPMDLAAEMATLSKRVYERGVERAKVRTLLCNVYHHSLHGRYGVARDQLLMSHLGDVIHGMDISTQILYNRALVRLGLCAFSNELVVEAHAALMELAAGARTKELLAQAVTSQRYGERNPDQERQERRRLVPYHMHINLELVEAVHLFCAMLLELPNLAHNAFDPKRRSAVVSKTFRRYLDQFERQVFNGPPENTRDHVMTAAHLLLEGEWRKAADQLTSMAVWDLLPDPARTRAFLRAKIQTEGLRAYLISSYAHFDSLSLSALAERFDLPPNETHALVSKMLLDGTIHACWDQPTDTLAVQRMEPTKLQFLALQFADKCAQLVEANERVLDSRTGSYGYKHEPRDGYGERSRRPWVERGDRGGHHGGGGGGYKPWHERRDGEHGFNRPWQDRRDGGGRGGGGRGWGGRSDRQQLDNYKGRRF